MKLRISLVLLVLVAASAWGQAGTTLPVTIDGKISVGEYSFSTMDNGITVAARLSADAKTLYIAISAPTTGWVAIGVGSRRMSGAFMVLGYFSDDKQSISTEQGAGYSHSPVAATDIVAVVTELSGVTTMELSMPASKYVNAGVVSAITAFGLKDNFRSLHSKRLSLDIRL